MYMLGTEHGLVQSGCTKSGSVLCASIHGLPTQSTDCAIHSMQSTDLRAIHTHCESVYLSLLL